MILELEPFLHAAPRLVRADIAALGVTFGRAAAQIGEIAKWRGAFFGRFLRAGQVPFFAHPGRHAGAETEAADQFILQAVLLHQIEIFAARRMAPHEDRFFEIVLDQGFDRFGAHSEGIDGETILELCHRSESRR